MVEGTAAGEYASQLLKAGDAAQPKGCSARFMPTITSTIAMKPHSMVQRLRLTCKILPISRHVTAWIDEIYMENEGHVSYQASFVTRD